MGPSFGVVSHARCRESLERSRARRSAARRRRRELLRVRGGAVSLAAVALAMATGGAALSLADSGIDARAGSVKAEVTIRKGDRGRAVSAIQRKLRLEADGVFGLLTERAVKRFQRRKGLEADGIVGPDTRAAMRLRPFAHDSVVHPRKGAKGRGSGGVRNLPPVLARIAECESGGDPSAVTSDGRYRGKYQYTRSTWKSAGGRGSDPAKAPEAHQDRVAIRLYKARGTEPWPTCG